MKVKEKKSHFSLFGTKDLEAIQVTFTALTQLVECETFNLKVKGSTPLCGRVAQGKIVQKKIKMFCRKY
jgi:hypothetical protein